MNSQMGWVTKLDTFVQIIMKGGYKKKFIKMKLTQHYENLEII